MTDGLSALFHIAVLLTRHPLRPPYDRSVALVYRFDVPKYLRPVCDRLDRIWSAAGSKSAKHLFGQQPTMRPCSADIEPAKGTFWLKEEVASVDQF